ncbi:hypothetical protein ACSSTF_004841, partial [Escherichia coli]
YLLRYFIEKKETLHMVEKVYPMTLEGKEKLEKELCELSKEFFNKVLATKKEFLPSMKEEDRAFLHKKLSEFRRGLLSDEINAHFHIGQIITDAILITFSDESLEPFD